jgi:MFS family permease
LAASRQERASAIRFIVCLGVVSLFADITYEGARSIIGPFLKDLGASAAQVGVIAGLGEMCGASLRLISGRLADRTRAYWTLAIFGYIVNMAVVPALAFAGSWQAAAVLVIAERTGKSLRGPSRDVLLSEATHMVGHGWGFGLHALFDQIGAVTGPLLIAAALARTNHFGPAFLPLAIPAAGALIALAVARTMYPSGASAPPAETSGPLPRVFWTYVAAAGLLACGFVDFPLLAYHWQTAGIARPAAIPLLYAGAMAMNGISAPVFGKLFDRHGIAVLAGGILLSLAALPLGFLGGMAGAVIGIACWGAGMGVQDASLRSGVAQVVSMNKRGGAFGAFNAVYGVMWFVGSAAMGFLYQRSVPALVAFGSLAQLAAAVMFFGLRRPLAVARKH